MTTLITGIHGFVGSNLVGYLSQDKVNTIYGLDIVAPEKPGVAKTYSWDDLDAGNVPEVDAVIHLAGKAHDTKNKSAAEVYFKVNTGLTQKIFDWFLACKGARKFVFFSTAKSAADRVEGVLTEDVVPTPVGPYGESKIKAEEYMIGRFAPAAAIRPNHSFDDSDSAFPGKSVYILRPCMIHGPGATSICSIRSCPGEFHGLSALSTTCAPSLRWRIYAMPSAACSPRTFRRESTTWATTSRFRPTNSLPSSARFSAESRTSGNSAADS